jgi:glycosyltransferase involved in cell wall biosynthesis
LLKDPSLVQERAARGLERVRTQYSWEAVADAYEGLFRALRAGSG